MHPNLQQKGRNLIWSRDLAHVHQAYTSDFVISDTRSWLSIMEQGTQNISHTSWLSIMEQGAQNISHTTEHAFQKFKSKLNFILYDKTKPTFQIPQMANCNLSFEYLDIELWKMKIKALIWYFWLITTPKTPILS